MASKICVPDYNTAHNDLRPPLAAATSNKPLTRVVRFESTAALADHRDLTIADADVFAEASSSRHPTLRQLSLVSPRRLRSATPISHYFLAPTEALHWINGEEYIGLVIPLMTTVPIFLGLLLFDIAQQREASQKMTAAATFSGIFAGLSVGACLSAGGIYLGRALRNSSVRSRRLLRSTWPIVPSTAGGCAAAAALGLRRHNISSATRVGAAVGALGIGWVAGYHLLKALQVALARRPKPQDHRRPSRSESA